MVEDYNLKNNNSKKKKDLLMEDTFCRGAHQIDVHHEKKMIQYLQLITGYADCL
jgi:hypothetical protein